MRRILATVRLDPMTAGVLFGAVIGFLLACLPGGRLW